jgi:hypothetical protein
MIRAVICALIAGALAAVPASARSAGPLIAERYAYRAAHIDTLGTRFDGELRRGSGSGFLVGDRLVLTNSHVVPRPGDFQTLTIEVRLGQNTAQPQSAHILRRDPEADLALLELDEPVAQVPPSCPLPAVVDDTDVHEGEDIWIIGFPMDRARSIVRGVLSSKEDLHGRWQTDAAINPGNSGGPAFDEDGRFVGVAVGGIRTWTPTGGEPIAVEGINFLVPARRLFEGELSQQMLAPPPCWLAERQNRYGLGVGPSPNVEVAAVAQHRTIFDAVASLFGVNATAVQIPANKGPESFVEEVPVRKELAPAGAASSSTIETISVSGAPGYRLTSCEPVLISARWAEVGQCVIKPDGTNASFQLRLTSSVSGAAAPAWWEGSVLLSQERR